MKLLSHLLGLKTEQTTLFADENGKTLAEYQRELLVKAGREEFQKLTNLGLAIPVQLV
jgi:hypothetical protein